MIYNDKLWQSINKTNQESEYLQFCRAKAFCQFRIHCLLEAVCYFNLLALQDPQWLLYVHFKSSSSKSQFMNSSQDARYLYKKFLVYFLYDVHCTLLWAMLTFVSSAHLYELCTFLWALHIFMSFAHFCELCTFLWALHIFVSYAHFWLVKPCYTKHHF